LTLDVAIDDPGIKSVELFIGQHCGDDCPRATTPPGLASMTIDDAYIVKDPTPFRAVDTEFTDGVAGFRIETDSDTTLDVLVVVGYDAQGVIKWSRTFGGVPVSHSDTSRWRIELEPTTPITPTFQAQPAGTERIARWAQPTASTPACLLIEHWSDAPTPNRDLVVPDADHDCDGVAVANECAPWIPNAIGTTPTIDAANCVTHMTDPGGTSTICVLGGPECTEDPSMTREACVQVTENYCTPSALCQCLGVADQASCLRSVVTNGTNGTAAMPFLKCVIAVDASGNRCDDTQIQIDGGPFLFNSRNCTSIGIADGELPVGPFQDYLALGDAKLKLGTFVEPCKIDVDWGPGLAPMLTFAVLDLALDNKNHLTVPARIEVKSGCGTLPSGCVLMNNNSSDSMFACVQATTPATCLPDSDHGCAGPYCGGVCCGFGEQCVNGQCKCGGNPACVGGNSCQTGLPNETQCGSICCGATGPCPI
jgi:hypothetical protein